MAPTRSTDGYNGYDFTGEGLKLVATEGGAARMDTLNDFSDVFHEDVEIKLFYEGNATLLIGNNAVDVGAGDVVFIHPYEFHSTIDYGVRKGKYYLLIIGLDFFENSSFSLDLRHLFIKERVAFHTLIQNNERVVRIIRDIVLEMNEKADLYENIVRGLVAELFCLLLRSYKSDTLSEHPDDKHIRYYEIIYPAIKKIRKDYTKKISVEELAALCNVSKYHFCRIFKEVTNVSAVQYQTVYRLRLADAFLKNSNKSIAEIATACGFEDVHYFSRCYKKNIGVSPREKRAILCK